MSKDSGQAGHRGQALIETAIFGSIMIMLLGVMVGYGLNYDYNQSSLMRSFREALGMASEPVNPLVTCEEVWSGQKKDKRVKKACDAGCDCAVYFRKPSADRKCEAICYPFGSGNYAIVEDRHVPDPSNPYGLGSTISSSSSAQVIRDPSQQLLPDNDFDLPRMRMRIAGSNSAAQDEVDCKSADDRAGYGLRGCTTAGYRIFNNVKGFVPTDWIDRKNGRRAGFGTKDGENNQDFLRELGRRKDQKCVNLPGVYKKGEKPPQLQEWRVAAIDKLEEIYGPSNVWLDDDGDSDPDTQQTCMNADGTFKLVSVKVLDPVGGELVNKDVGLSIAQQIADQNVCTAQCERARRFITDCTTTGKPDPTGTKGCICGTKGCKALPIEGDQALPACADICKQPLPEIPWYAQASTKGLTYQIEDLFAGGVMLGLQPGSTRDTEMTNSLRRVENSKALATDTSIDWTDTTTRHFNYYQPGPNNTMGQIVPIKKDDKKGITTKKTVKDEHTWTTPW